ncbi:MAG: pyrroloquinoline quinone biosynthesis protein PqqE [Thiothrix sp.]|nr:pyrroloquinoline quinone biosynthesis protein PqqE [Thiothrix sp.]HPQ95305.1 pyrroloquinoline quinone biosynthesis protein PqqE [Thiolinea sp.]
MARIPPPLWLLAEVTHSCPLQCPYCSNPLTLIRKQEELDTEGWLKVLHEARKLGAAQLGFSGGEPLVRKDLSTLVGAARQLGYYTNLITSGVGMDAERVAELHAQGLDHIQISFQSDSQALNDYIAGCESFEQKKAMARAVKAQGYPMVLCFVIHRLNIDHVAAMLELAAELEADYVELATTQYEGWALLNRDQLLPSRQQVQAAEAVAHHYQEKFRGRMKIYFVVPDYYEGRPKPCVDGWGRVFLAVAPDGVALPCHAARDLPGLEFANVRDHSLEWIWYESPAFNAFRGTGWMKEPCASCDQREKDYGGCRCQAFKLTGDARNTDPTCSLSPLHQVVTEAAQQAEQSSRSAPDRPLVFRNRRNSPKVNTIP